MAGKSPPAGSRAGLRVPTTPLLGWCRQGGRAWHALSRGLCPVSGDLPHSAQTGRDPSGFPLGWISHLDLSGTLVLWLRREGPGGRSGIHFTFQTLPTELAGCGEFQWFFFFSAWKNQCAICVQKLWGFVCLGLVCMTEHPPLPPTWICCFNWF